MKQGHLYFSDVFRVSDADFSVSFLFKINPVFRMKVLMEVRKKYQHRLPEKFYQEQVLQIADFLFGLKVIDNTSAADKSGFPQLCSFIILF